MSKSKKALIIATILIVVGIVGAIPTGIYAIPKLINDVESNINSIQYKEKDIATFKEDIENLNIDFNDKRFSIEFRKSKDNLTHLKCYEGYKDRVEYSSAYDLSSKTFKLNIKEKHNFFNNVTFKNGLANFITDIYSYNEKIRNRLIVEVPKGVNLTLKNIVGYQNIINITESSVLKDSLYIDGSGYDLNIPEKNNLKDVYIRSYGNYGRALYLDLRQFLNAKNVTLISNHHILINSGGSLSEYDVKKLPEQFNLTSDSIEIKSFVPLGKNTNINSTGFTSIQMPFDSYNISGKLVSKSHEENRRHNDNNLSHREINDVSNNIAFSNLNINLVNGVFEGKYSAATGDEYKLNINTYEGEIVNTALSQLEMILQGR